MSNPWEGKLTLTHLIAKTAKIIIAKFGRQSLFDTHERGKRCVEEAVELAQSLEVPQHEVLQIVMHVYKHKPGNIFQEMAGLGVCYLAAVTALGIDAESNIDTELDRLSNVSQDMIDAKQQTKNAAGITSY